MARAAHLLGEYNHTSLFVLESHMKKDIDTSDLFKRKRAKVQTKGGLSTGSTLLNLACTGKPNVGLVPGCYYNFTGDSESGKTFLGLTIMAEASISPEYKHYRLRLNQPEHGAKMDFAYFFGDKMANKLETVASSTVEEFYYDVDNALKEKIPFIYLLDSMDALTSTDEQDTYEENKKLVEKGKEAKGSYGTAKAKRNSSDLRVVTNKLADTGSILLMISQTRANIGFTSKFKPKTRSGGNALRFYATNELWTSIKERLTKRVRGKERETGIVMKVKVEKNRLNGRHRTVEIPIHYDTGLDDIGSCVLFLVDEKHWKEEKGGTIHAEELGIKGKYDDLVLKIEEEGMEKDLRSIVTGVWNEIEQECRVVRKSRYA